MDQTERNALHAADKAWSLEALERLADVVVIPREHRYDGLLTDHSRNMPTPEPASQLSRTLTDAEIARMIADQVRAALATHDRFWSDVHGAVIASERKKMRAHVAEQIGQLRADVTIANAHAGERSTVIDLPSSRRAG